MQPRVLNHQHFIFTTKNRSSLFTTALADRFAVRLAEICRLKAIQVATVAVMPDHVHVFALIPHTMTQAQAAMLMKWYTARYLRIEYPELPSPFWGHKYFAHSVGGDANALRAYIDRQDLEGSLI